MTLYRAEQRRLIEMMYGEKAYEYSLLLESFGNFLEKEILPTARRIDEERLFPRTNLDRLFAQGFTAMAFPVKYGGLELPFPVYVAAMEMVAMSCASTAISVSIHGTTCGGIEKFASEEQKEEYLRPMIAGGKLGAFTLTEPHSGSDAGSLETRAERRGDEFVLNGSKIFISNGGQADLYFVFAKSSAGPSAFLVDKGTPGLRFGKNMPKLGIRGSTLVEVFFEDCSIPASKLVGKEGMGFEYAKEMLHGGRVTIGALSVGIAQMALERSVQYSKGRVTFGAPLAQRQMIRQKLADMATSVAAARGLTYHAAWLRQGGNDYSMEAAEAKLYASEMALKVCDDAIQIHGGYGYTDDMDVHRHWRDARLMTIGEGTSEVMRLVVSSRLLQGASQPTG
jgi:alkylation response protein AidB-like acyl-CoA dehydrogenase